MKITKTQVTFTVSIMVLLFSGLSAIGQSKPNYLITATSVGDVKFGMTIGEVRKVLKGVNFKPIPHDEGEGSDIGVFEGDKELMSIGFWGYPEYEKDSNGNPVYMDSNGKRVYPKLPPFDENQKITSIGIADSRYKTAEGVHVGMTIADAEKKYGPVILTQTNIAHVGEVGEFTNQPAYLGVSFRGKEEFKAVGIYGKVPNCNKNAMPGCRKTSKHTPGSYIRAMWIRTPETTQ